jgi:GNAT superfamily N-acetyltransferase
LGWKEIEENSMIILRPYSESDAPSVGRLIADTFGTFNLAYASPAERDLLLGPFCYARSQEPNHQAAIAEAIRAEMVYVAQDITSGTEPAIVGVLRGRPDKLQSLFVRGDHHRQGIGRRLVDCFERQCCRAGSTEIKVQATLYAVPFYLAVGYKRSTGVRSMRIFEGTRFPYQPMKKVLRP